MQIESQTKLQSNESFAQKVSLDDFLSQPYTTNKDEFPVSFEQVEQIQKIFERSKELFIDRILSLVKEGKLPIDEERIKQRASKINLEVFNPSGKNMIGKAGFSIIGFRMLLGTDLLLKAETEQNHIIFHELVHALLSGFSFSKFKIASFDMYEINKNGLMYTDAIDKTKPDHNRSLKNSDINEAVTEILALMILAGKDIDDWELNTDGTYLFDIEKGLGNPGYLFERNTLANYVFNKGVAWCDFLNAYTEEDSDKIYGQAIQRLNEKLTTK